MRQPSAALGAGRGIAAAQRLPRSPRTPRSARSQAWLISATEPSRKAARARQAGPESVTDGDGTLVVRRRRRMRQDRALALPGSYCKDIGRTWNYSDAAGP